MVSPWPLTYRKCWSTYQPATAIQYCTSPFVFWSTCFKKLTSYSMLDVSVNQALAEEDDQISSGQASVSLYDSATLILKHNVSWQRLGWVDCFCKLWSCGKICDELVQYCIALLHNLCQNPRSLFFIEHFLNKDTRLTIKKGKQIKNIVFLEWMHISSCILCKL